MAAAFGCQESEVRVTEAASRTGLPVGSPAAIIQYAQVCHFYMHQHIMDDPSVDNVAMDKALRQALKHPNGMSPLRTMLSITASSVQRGWISRFALQVANAIHDPEWMDHFDNENMLAILRPLLPTREYHLMQVE